MTSASGSPLPNISHPYPPSYNRNMISSPKNQSGDYNNPYDPPDYTMTRERSTSDSSLKDKTFTGKRPDGTDYPAEWTLDDEKAEAEFVAKGMFSWRELRSWRFWLRKEWIVYYLVLAVIVTLVVLMTVYHDQIVKWLTPVANYMKNLPAGWVIPIAILFVISFPPLFGHEIVAIICGIVWGLWVGFGIVAAGTLLGEVGNFYAFKYCCRGRAAKHEANDMNFATLAHVVRNGGFLIVFVARLSAIPGHLTTAVFATCGTNIWIFLIAAILTLPKQMITVYLGVIIEDKDPSSKNKIISDSVLGITFAVTIVAAWYIYRQMHEARIIVWRERRSASKSNDSKMEDDSDETTKSSSIAQSADVGINIVPVVKRNTLMGIGMGNLASPRTYRESYRKARPGEELEDDDARSPILQRASYQNPYDISYNQSNDMSIYDVEDRSPSAHGLLAQMASTRTKLQARRQNEEPPSVFPTPKPAPLPQGINRSNTSATTTDSHEMTIPDRQDFPVPSPARPESMTTPAGEGRGNMRSPPGSGAMHSGGAGRAQW